jgi:S-adenosylmethionine decarboxylase proenzyme
MVVSEYLRELGAGYDDMARVVRATLEFSDAWQVAGHANLPFAELLDILQKMRARGLIEFQGSEVRLTREGEAFARELGAVATRNVTCPHCAGSGYDLDRFARARAEFLPLLQERPPAVSSYDQGALTADSVFRRLAMMYAHGDVAGNSILVLGDDDLMSIALALTGLPREIVVLEIDPRLCEFVARTAREKNLPIRVIEHDARDRLPADLRARFDTFVTDPAETIQGLLLFVEKGLAMLKPGSGRSGYFGVSLIEASMRKWNVWERHLLQNHALVLTHISEPFSLYGEELHEPARATNGAGVRYAELSPFAHSPRAPWYRSSLFRVETLKEFVPPADFDSNPRDELYQDAESLDEAWTALARGESNSPVPIPDDFLNASAERAAQAQFGLGRHVIAEFWNCENAESDRGLAEAIEAAVREGGATLLDLQVRPFYPQGYSAVALLAESHLSLHAWPELGYVALDVFTCGTADPHKIVQALESHFQPGDTAYIKIPRGRRRESPQGLDAPAGGAVRPYEVMLDRVSGTA